MKREPPDNFDKKKIESFLGRWSASNASERANAQLFARELCDLLGVDPPHPATGDPQKDTYCFERPVPITRPDGSTTTNFIDLYKRGYFVLESKQGSERRVSDEDALLQQQTGKKGTAVRGTGTYDLAMQRAYVQAERYAKALDEWPPFLIVCDVGFCFELYSSFDGSGKYRHFPAPGEHRIMFGRIAEPEVFALLHGIFTEPKALDPSREAAKVTQEIAALVARLAVSLEKSGHAPELVAKFLMRCLFTMFAEDVGLLPPAENRQGLFTHALEHHWVPNPQVFPSQIEALWRTMNAGGAMFGVAGKILQFNGGLFADPLGLPMTQEQLRVLQLAALADWSGVEPAIFGTLLERALNPKERHRLGAHFTPRAYVERLVTPTIEEPIREEWNLIRAQVRQIITDGGKVEDAWKVLRAFHQRLVGIKVLDPACGSGNFLYVTLDLFKRIEAEVLAELADLGDKQMLFDVQHVSVNPGQFLGIEIKPWAREIADLCLWIGYLQWHHRTGGKLQPVEPVLREYHNIECRDALLAYDDRQLVLDEKGAPVTQWDGETTKVNPLTGEEVPDESARVSVFEYVNVRRAEWPEADFIVGNPPFIGGWRLRRAQGDGYVAALWKTYPEIPEKADYVMYWWHHAAEAVRAGHTRAFGLITTNSIAQVFQRRVLQQHLEAATNPLRVAFAVPDHPWVDSADAAAVRVAMTVGDTQRRIARLGEATDEHGDRVEIRYRDVPKINADLTSGANLDQSRPLRANSGLCSPGVQLYGSGFIIEKQEIRKFIRPMDDGAGARVIRRYMNGRDFMGSSRGAFVIDFFGLDEEAAAQAHPAAFQRVLDHVKPERDQNRRPSIRDNWWRFGWERPVWRAAVQGLKRFVSTPETSKHRVFVFMDESVLPDNMLTNFALEDAFFLGVLSSRIHLVWALASGGTLEDRPRYNKTMCFDPFPFPDALSANAAKVRERAEALDAHRKVQLEANTELTLTGIYNVLEKVRANVSLSEKERKIHEVGLVSLLGRLHDELDAAVFETYGWPRNLPDEEILKRLVTLNVERAAEERRGVVRWLRPEYQSPGGTAAEQAELVGTGSPTVTPVVAPKEMQKWPKEVPAQLAAIKALFDGASTNLSVEDVCAEFKGARHDKVLQHLTSLEALGLLDRYESSGGVRWHA